MTSKLLLKFHKNEEFSFFSSFLLALSYDYRIVIWLINFRNIWLTWAEEEKIIFLCYCCDGDEEKKNDENLFGILWRARQAVENESSKVFFSILRSTDRI